MMFCPACDEPIPGGDPDNAAFLPPPPNASLTADDRWRPHHFACVANPSELALMQFQKWAVWAIEEQRRTHERDLEAILTIIARNLGAAALRDVFATEDQKQAIAQVLTGRQEGWRDGQ